MKVKEFIALIEADGWQQVRRKGSHRQFHHPKKPGTVTVSAKPSIDVRRDYPGRTTIIQQSLRGFGSDVLTPHLGRIERQIAQRALSERGTVR